MKSGTTGRSRKILGSLIVGGLVAGVVGIGAYSAFTATTTNSGNSITSGTVAVSQHSGATAVISSTDQAPGASVAKCIRIAYTGSLAASVKLYGAAGVTNGDKYTLKVERGSGITAPAADMNCTGFTQSSDLYATGDLSAFNTSHTNFASGYDGKASGAAWATNDTVDYRFTVTTKDDATANAHTTSNPSGTFTFTWEAQNN